MSGGGFFQLARDYGDVFTSSKINDVLINTVDGSEKIIMGTFQNADGTLFVSTSNIRVLGYIDVRDDLISNKGYLNVQGVSISNDTITAGDVTVSNLNCPGLVRSSNIVSSVASNDTEVVTQSFTQHSSNNMLSASNAVIVDGKMWTATSSNATIVSATIYDSTECNLTVLADAIVLGNTNLYIATTSNIKTIEASASNAVVTTLSNMYLHVLSNLIGSNGIITTLSNTDLSSSNIYSSNITSTSNTLYNVISSNIRTSNLGSLHATISNLSNVTALTSPYGNITTLSNTNANIFTLHASNVQASNITVASNLTVNPMATAIMTTLFSTSNTCSNLSSSNVTACNATLRTSYHIAAYCSNLFTSNLTTMNVLTGNTATLSNLTMGSNITTVTIGTKLFTASNSTVQDAVAFTSSNSNLYGSNILSPSVYASNVNASNVYAGFADISSLKILSTTCDTINASNAYFNTSSNDQLAASNATITTLSILSNIITPLIKPQIVDCTTLLGLTASNFANVYTSNLVCSNITMWNITGKQTTAWFMYGSNCTLCNKLSADSVDCSSITNSYTITTGALSVSGQLSLGTNGYLTGTSATLTSVTASNVTASQVNITSNLRTSNATILRDLFGSNVTACNVTSILFNSSSNCTFSNVNACNLNIASITSSTVNACNLTVDSNANFKFRVTASSIVASNGDFSNITVPGTLTLSNIACSNGTINEFSSTKHTVTYLSNVTLSNGSSTSVSATASNVYSSNITVANTIKNALSTLVLDMNQASIAAATTTVTTMIGNGASVSNLRIATQNVQNTKLDLYGAFAIYNPQTNAFNEHFYGGYSNNTIMLRAANASNGIDFAISSNATGAPTAAINNYKSVMTLKHNSASIHADTMVTGQVVATSFIASSNIVLSNADPTKTPNLQVMGIMSGDKHTHPLHHGLIVHYVFDDIDNNIIDRSKRCNNAVMTGNAYTRVDYAYGKAFNITDSSGTLTLVNPPVVPVMTVSFWFMNNEVISSSFGTMISSPTNNFIYLAFDNTGRLCYGKGLTPLTQTNFTIAPNKWYHICMLISNNTCSLYINGSLAQTIPNYLDITLYPVAKIGNSSIGTMGGVGLYSDFRIYDRVLSSNEVSKLYNMIAPVFKADQSSDSVKKLIIYETPLNIYNDWNYYGLGYSNSKLYYQVPSTGTHSFGIGTVDVATIALSPSSNLSLTFTDQYEKKRVVFGTVSNNEFQYYGLYRNSNEVGINVALPTDQIVFSIGTSDTSNIKPMYLTSNGAGIFNSNPLKPLDVIGDIHCTGKLIADQGTNYWEIGSVPYAIKTSNVVCIESENASEKLNINGNIYLTGTVMSQSDSKSKTEIERIADALSKVNSISGYTYRKTDGLMRETGLIAQELQRVLPEAVRDTGSELTVAYGNVVGLLVEAIKELTSKVDSLQKQIYSLI